MLVLSNPQTPKGIPIIMMKRGYKRNVHTSANATLSSLGRVPLLVLTLFSSLAIFSYCQRRGEEKDSRLEEKTQ